MGRVLHFEIHASDPQASMAFYSAALGWAFEPYGDFPYWFAKTGDGDGINGAIMQRDGPPPAGGAPVMGATVTHEVDDIDAASRTITNAGGTPAVPKMAVPGVGWAAYFKDPDGNVFGIFQNDEGAA